MTGINIDGRAATVEGRGVQAGKIDTGPVFISEPIPDDENQFGDVTYNTSEWGVTTSPESFFGNYIWESFDTNMSYSRLDHYLSYSGLPNYPVAGDIFSFYAKEITSSNDNTSIYTAFGVQDSSNNYGVKVRKASPISIVKDRSVVVSGSNYINDGVWYDVEVSWGTNGDIVVTVYEVDGSGTRTNQYDQISYNDTSYTSGGVGWILPEPTGGGIAHQYWTIDGGV